MSGPFRPRGGEPPDEPPEERPVAPPAPEPEPEPEPRRPQRPPPRKRGLAANTTWIVGVIATLFVVYITYNTITTDSPGSRGVPDGTMLPPFNVPLALSNLKCEDEDGNEKPCDANVQTVARKGIPAACDVHVEGAVNSCELVKKGPVVVAFLADPSGRCVSEIDALDELAPRFPDVQFLAVAIRGDHAELNDIIREHGWKIPVAYDHDGAVANAFAVAVCPTITFARKGGEVEHTTLGTAPEAEIVQHLRAIQ